MIPRGPSRPFGERGTPLWIVAAQYGSLSEAILAYVRAHDNVSFPELRDHLGDYFDVRGDCRLMLDNNVCLWANLSQELADAVAGLHQAGKLFFRPVSELTYLIDGCVLTLPLAKRVPKGGYQVPHWLPVVMRLEPPKQRRAKGKY